MLTWDSDLLPENQDLRIAYVGTKNYDIGVNLAKIVQEIKPDGGTICIQSGGAAAANHNERMQGIRDTLGGMSGTTSPGERLTGENGWTEVDGCPLYTDDDFPRSVQQMEDTLAKYPDLDAFVPTGGFPQFVPDAYRNVATKVKDRIDSKDLALVVADTLPVQMDLMKEGLSLGQVGQRPFEMGYKTMHFLLGDQEGRQEPRGSDLHRPRRLHARDRRQLHRRLSRPRSATAAPGGRRQPSSGPGRAQAGPCRPDARSAATAADLRIAGSNAPRRRRYCRQGRSGCQLDRDVARRRATGSGERGRAMADRTDIVRLRQGAFELEVCPGLGGCITAFRHRGRDLMRPGGPALPRAAPTRAPPAASRWCRSRTGSPTPASRFQGRVYQLPANFLPEPHAIHGDGWQHPWTRRRGERAPGGPRLRASRSPARRSTTARARPWRSTTAA